MEGGSMGEKLSAKLGKTFSGSYDPHYKMSKSRETSQESGKLRSVREICAEFADMTSMQGVNYIHHSRKMWLKFLWLLIFFAGTGAMIFHLSYLSTLYFSYKIQTNIDLGFDSLTFPAVTVCNINPIRASMLKESGSQMEKLMQDTNTTNQINHLTKPEEAATAPSGNAPGARRRRKRYLDDLSVNYTNSYSAYQDNINTDPWAKEANRTTEARVEQEFGDLFSRLSRAKRIRIGHQLEDFMVQSSFAGRRVPNRNFKIHQSPVYGNCFTLQYSDFLSRKSGPTDGLEMVLFLENEEYLRGWTNGNGAHLVVHEHDSVPLIQQDGVAIAGGSETFIGIKRINIQRIGRPYAYCNDGATYKSLYNVTYTRQVCQDFCRVRLVSEKCNCYDSRQDETNMIFNLLKDSRPCRTAEEVQCLVRVERDYEAGNYSSECVCYNPCKETKFEKTLSARQWPSFEYGKVLVEAICAKSTGQACQKLRAYDGFRLSHNFIKLNIFYEDLNYENITEDADYAEAQFLSDIGGTLGLWIGLSVMSLFELFQFFIELIHSLCSCNTDIDNRKRDGRVRSDQTAPERLGKFSNTKTPSDYGDYRMNHRLGYRN